MTDANNDEDLRCKQEVLLQQEEVNEGLIVHLQMLLAGSEDKKCEAEIKRLIESLDIWDHLIQRIKELENEKEIILKASDIGWYSRACTHSPIADVI